MLNGDATKMKETKNNKAVLNFDEENEITIIGYRLVYWKWFLTMVAMIGSAGLLWLLLYWMPQWKLWWTHEQAQFIYLDSTLNCLIWAGPDWAYEFPERTGLDTQICLTRLNPGLYF